MGFCMGFCVLVCGCATTRTTDTPRTAIEQLLVSYAVDEALNRVDFSTLAGRAVFVQEKYLDGIDKNYVAASVRHRLLGAGARLVDQPTDADVIVEIRNGGLGTDRMESFIGTPRVDMPGPLPVQIPDVQLATNKRQTGTAKIGIVAYDAKTRQAIGTGGMVVATTDDSNWFVFGIGPFRSGSVRQELQRAEADNSFPVELARLIPFRWPTHDPIASQQAPSESVSSPTVAPATSFHPALQQPTFAPAGSWDRPTSPP